MKIWKPNKHALAAWLMSSLFSNCHLMPETTLLPCLKFRTSRRKVQSINISQGNKALFFKSKWWVLVMSCHLMSETTLPPCHKTFFFFFPHTQHHHGHHCLHHLSSMRISNSRFHPWWPSQRQKRSFFGFITFAHSYHFHFYKSQGVKKGEENKVSVWLFRR